MIKILFIALTLGTSIVFADGEYAKHDSSLYQLVATINSSEKVIKEAIKAKNETTDPVKAQEYVEEIKTELKKRKETIIKYNKEFHHIKYEHPGKAGVFNTKYKRYDEKSIKEFEDEVNKLLSDVQKNVKKKYNQ